jgi:hypothetical protein
MAVKLKNVTTGKPGSYTVKLPPEVNTELMSYQAAYQEQYGEEIQADVLITAIVGEYLASDSQFQASKKDNAKGGTKRKPKTPATVPPATNATSEAA